MRTFLLLSIIGLSGCVYQSVTTTDIEHAQMVCAKHKAQVVEIYADFSGSEHVLCDNLITYYITPQAIKNN